MNRLFYSDVERRINEMYQAVAQIEDDEDKGIAFEHAVAAEKKLLDAYRYQERLFNNAEKLVQALTSHESPQLWRIEWLSTLLKAVNNPKVYPALADTNENHHDSIGTMLHELGQMLTECREVLKEINPPQNY